MLQSDSAAADDEVRLLKRRRLALQRRDSMTDCETLRHGSIRRCHHCVSRYN